MRRIRYGVAMSLDGYIAGSNGEADWIVADPEFDFGELWAQFDTLLMGRRTFEAAKVRFGESFMQGIKIVVVSRTLQQADHPNVTLFSDVNQEWIHRLRAQGGKDIWLMGGGKLFGSVLEIGEVDTIEVSLVPVLLGGGVPLLPPVGQRTKLSLSHHRVYRSGLVSLTYDLRR